VKEQRFITKDQELVKCKTSRWLNVGHIAGQPVDALAETATLFGLEGPLRHGIRADLCLQGWTWDEADEMAREMLTDAFRAVRAIRLSWDEGQLEWTIHAGTLIERTRCIRCHAPLHEGHHKFCSSVCGASHNQRLATRKRAQGDVAVKLATTSI
jgi:hypothetical protein